MIQALAEIVPVTLWDALPSEMAHRLQQALQPNLLPIGLVIPNTVEQLSAVVSKLHHDRIAMVPMGSGSKLDWGASVTQPAVFISTEHLNKIVDHAIGDLTVTAQAGIKFETLQSILQQWGQFLAIDPSCSSGTIGGIVATGDSGALRHRYNSVRDMVLGVEFVRSDGKIVKAGGRVVKNVAGYDLMKLLTGSYGTLGILTQVTVRLYPNQEASQTILLAGDPEILQRAIQGILNSGLTPSAMDLLSLGTMKVLELGSSMGLLIQFQGLTESVQEQCDRVLELGKSLFLNAEIQAIDQLLWNQVSHSLSHSMVQGHVVCKWAVRSNQTVSALLQVQAMVPDALARFHVSGGLGQLQLKVDVAGDVVQKIRSICEVNGGFLSILMAPSDLKSQLDSWGFRGNGGSWMRSIQQQFDPLNILSPGRMEG
jgi:glycolate oxidase FAD binding subunit